MAEESVVAVSGSDATAFPEALARVQPEMDALGPDDLMTVNVEIMESVTTVLGLWPLLLQLRRDIEEELPKFKLARFDKLPDYARALWQTHALHHKSAPGPTDVQKLAEEGADLRETLLVDITALVRRGLLKPEYLDVKSPVSYRGLAQSLSALAGALTEHWSTVASKTAVQPSEIDRANALAHQLVMAVSEREQTAVALEETARQRLRAYTLFMRAYGDAKRAVDYLRYEHGDAETFAPSLYAGRGGGNIRKKEEAQPQPPSPAPVPAPSLPNVVLATPNNVPVGMPGSNPLV